MPLPFGVADFLEVFARYNQAVWPAQVALELAALWAVVVALRHPGGGTRTIAVILGMLWLWMGLVYHLVFFRAINPAAVAFGAAFVAEGLLLCALPGWRRKVRFGWTPDASGLLGAVLIGYALIVYPLVGYALGHRYPTAPTFGLPCPTTILTLGLLVWARPRPWSLLVIPLLWSAVGASAAVQLGMWEDLGLVAAGSSVLALPLITTGYASRCPEARRAAVPGPPPRVARERPRC
jgi:uncharacterized protein DUF6064